VGQIHSKEDLYIDGVVEGTIEVDSKLTIGPKASVHAHIKAVEVILLGESVGNIEAADMIEIRQDGKLVGDIRTARIVIEDGAYFKGSIDIVRNVSPRLAVLGTPEADAADAQAVREIQAHAYTTFEDPKSLRRILSGSSHAATAAAPAVAPERASAIWDRD
jgi:cytoskeletal protein CcmA (bactofilin family)